MNKYVVIDTNLLVSAALIKGSSSYSGIKTILTAGHTLIFTSSTFSELEKVISRPKFDRYISKENREEYLSLYARVGRFVIPEKHFMHCRDTKDNIFLDAAVAGQVDSLITGDSDLLDLKEIEGIPIQTMAVFLKQGK